MITAPAPTTRTCAVGECTSPPGQLNICSSHTRRHRQFLAFGFTIEQTRGLVLAGYSFTTLPARTIR